MSYFAHPTACIDEGAQVGEGSKIWHFSHVMGSARIGEHCNMGQNVYVGRNVVIGHHVKIQNNVSVYEGVTLEDYVFCGPSMVFTNIRTPRSAFPRNHSEDCQPTRVRYGATVGANATIICGVTIGRWALIGAGAVVTHDVPDHAIMIGVPAKQTGWACECGVPLTVEGDRAACRECNRRYTLQGTVITKL